MVSSHVVAVRAGGVHGPWRSHPPGYSPVTATFGPSPKPQPRSPPLPESGSWALIVNVTFCPTAGWAGVIRTSAVIGALGPGFGSQRKSPQAGSLLLRHGLNGFTVVLVLELELPSFLVELPELEPELELELELLLVS